MVTTMMKILVLAVLLEATSAFVPINPETLTGQALVNYVNSAQSMFTAEYSNKKFTVFNV
ncbi:Protein CBG22430 [Caenorhabditis briggsae]|uniref:Protein CBG22430 n=1 Tax=Caenorhabditis briggsae TaxID=6238 RepID=A8Y298_CAEBR|nr:Protein CBG22430 [Caenorhabditis briggsae]CAP39018.1 Protein CBG22430 [Caenorhabditis briggsae]